MRDQKHSTEYEELDQRHRMEVTKADLKEARMTMRTRILKNSKISNNKKTKINK